MKKIYYIVLFSILIGTYSCDDFFDRSPYDKIYADDFFKSEKDLELYSNGFLQKMTPGSGTIGNGDSNADYCAVQTPADLLRPDGNIGPHNQGGWGEDDWKKLRNINYYLVNMVKAKDAVDEKTYNHYEAIGRFWRAWFYYDKVQTFGAVPFYEEPISPTDVEALMKGKDSREYVMDKILEDLNFAAEYCSDEEKYAMGGSGITKAAVLAFKSRVCLFEGTYRKYHSVDPSTGKSWENQDASVKKFLNEAVDAAEKVMTSKKYDLVTGDVKTAYRSLFVSEKLNLKEVIWGRQYSKELTQFHDLTWIYFSPTYGNKMSMTKKFMNTYLMKDGTPFTALANYKTIEFADEFTDRDARMAQTVIGPEYRMTQGGVNKPYAPNWLRVRTGYNPIKWSLDDDADNVTSRGASWNSLPILRYAEVLLNYAEAKAELGQFDATEWAKTIAPIRERAGVSSVIPANADQYMVDYFNGTVTDKWILEIRRERGIELCLEMGLRWDDLMRWKMGDLLNSAENPWTGIYIPSTNQEYDFNGDGKIDLKFVSKESEASGTAVFLAAAESDQSFTLNRDNNIQWNYQRTWNEYKYLRPIPTDAITRNPNLEQNVLWVGK